MGLSKTTCAVFLLLFLFLFLVFSEEESSNGSGPVVYDIDYRGPETHTTIPPPKRGGRRRNIIHHQQTMVARHKRSNAVRASSHGHNGKKYRK